jgi:hypothetical protein
MPWLEECELGRRVLMVRVPSQEPLMQLVQYHWFSEQRRSMETMLMLLQLPTPTTPTTPPPPLELVDALF